MATEEQRRLRAAVTRHTPSEVLEEPGLRRAAVALIFTPGERGLELCMIRRSEHPEDPWSGHMAFPGGRREPEDVSSLATAIRETDEEIGVVLPPETLLGPLSPIRVPARVSSKPMVIEPFVFCLRQKMELAPNEEVAGVYFFSLDGLVEGEGRGEFELPHRGEKLQLDCIDQQGVRIWGLSLRMLDELLQRL